jgi:myo-inositol-1(or 4)-monophosphatase
MASTVGNNDLNIDECFEAVRDVATKAGLVVREAFTQNKEVLTKSTFADLVTETDRKVEEIIIGTLRTKFPNHSFIGEESAVEGQHFVLTNSPTWIIDPVDGTTNFVHKFPQVAISIALVVNKRAEIGLIYNPIMDELYTARSGHGSFCNGVLLKATNVDDLSHALVCTEFGSSRDAVQLDSKFRGVRAILERVHGIRSLGSAALNMCAVAAGRADAYWEFGIHAWDIAAADLIVREAGGVVMSTDGGPLDLMHRRVLCAGTAKLAKSISRLILQIDLESD